MTGSPTSAPQPSPVEGGEARGSRAAVVCESMFGNTSALGEAIGAELRLRGFEVEEMDVSVAPPVASLEVDLLVVGAPTHAFSLSRPATRADAVRQGADEAHARTGVREWLQAGSRDHVEPTLAISTLVSARSATCRAQQLAQRPASGPGITSADGSPWSRSTSRTLLVPS